MQCHYYFRSILPSPLRSFDGGKIAAELGSIKVDRPEQPAEAILQNISIHKYLTRGGKAAVINFENDLQYHSFEPGAQ